MTPKDQVEFGALRERVEGLAEKVKGLVSQAEFAPVKALVYGMTGLALTTLFGALVKLVILK